MAYYAAYTGTSWYKLVYPDLSRMIQPDHNTSLPNSLPYPVKSGHVVTISFFWRERINLLQFETGVFRLKQARSFQAGQPDAAGKRTEEQVCTQMNQYVCTSMYQYVLVCHGTLTELEYMSRYVYNNGTCCHMT